MEKHKFTGKTKEEAIDIAQTELQELAENLIIRETEVQKGGLFKSKKVEIEVIEKRNIATEIKNYLAKLLKDLGFNANIEVKMHDQVPTYTIYSDNDALLIGKNGKNLHALSIVVGQYIKKEIGKSYKFLIDINDYKEKHERALIRLAKNVAKEVAQTKIEAKMDSMNSYERRIIHNALANFKGVATISEGEEPNRHIIVKPSVEK